MCGASRAALRTGLADESPPFLTPPILPVRNRRYVSGEVPLADRRRLYINRGLGHLLQVRFNVRPEITVFTLARSIS